MKKFILSFTAFFLLIGIVPIHAQDYELKQEEPVQEKVEDLEQEEVIENESEDLVEIQDETILDTLEDEAQFEPMDLEVFEDEDYKLPNKLVLDEWEYKVDDVNNRIILDYYKGGDGEVYIPGSFVHNGNTYDVAIKDRFAFYYGDIKTLVIEEVNGKKVTNLNPELLGTWNNVSSIRYLDARGLDISNTTSLKDLFKDAYNIQYIDISTWDTSHITDMSYMFKGTRFTDTSRVSLDTSNLAKADYMFSGALFTDYDFASMDTHNLVSALYMFNGARNIEYLDVSGWDISKLEKAVGLFHAMYSLKEINVEGLDVSNITDFSFMFGNLSEIEEIDLSSWGYVDVRKMGSMFANNSKMKTLNIKGFDLLKTTSFERTFERTHSLETVILDSFKNEKASFVAYMMRESAYNGFDFSEWTTSSLNNTTGMFMNNTVVEHVDLSNTRFLPLRFADQMFKGATNLKSISFPERTFNNTFYMNSAFEETLSLEFVDLTGAVFDDIINQTNMFKTSIPTKLLVVGNDQKIIDHDYVSDNRVPILYDGITLHSGTGKFSDGSTTAYIDAKFNDYVAETVFLKNKAQLNKYLRQNTPVTTKPKHTFIGWDVNLDTLSYPIDLRTTTLELTARYDGVFNVTFDIDGDLTTQEVINHEFIDQTQIPDIPEKVGHTILGWTLEGENTVFDLDLEIVEDLTLVPLYLPDTLTVSFVIDGQQTPVDVLYGHAIDGSKVPQIPSKDGYSIKGWALQGQSSLYDLTTPVTESITLVPVYSQNEYTVSFLVDSQTTTTSVLHGEVIDAADIPTIPSKPGYTSKGWTIQGQNTIFNLAQAITEDLTLVPLYEQNKYTVTFTVNNLTQSVSVLHGEKIKLDDVPTIPTKPGYSIKGWALQGQNVPFDLTSVITENINLVALYDQNEYTVSFLVDGVTTSVNVLHGETLDSQDIPTIPVKDRYDILGWALQGQTQLVDLTQGITQSMTLVPVYDQNEFTVTFEIESQIIELSVSKNGIIQESDIPQVPHKSGYVFKGWSEDITAQNIVLFDFLTPVTKDLKLVAYYQKEETPIKPVVPTTPVEPTTPPTGINSLDYAYLTLFSVATLVLFVIISKKTRKQ